MENVITDAHKVAADVTKSSASNLWFVGRALSREKRQLFEASYATMRVIDDFVDDDFLEQSESQRIAGRAAAHRRVRDWLTAAEQACAGATLAQSTAPLSTEPLSNNPVDGQLFLALRHSAGSSDIPADPWRQLAAAMAFDIDETPMQDWEDFYRYCEGATVAPAAVFLYVLQAGRTADGLRAGLDAVQLMDQARDMAVFCYLVHILRDFAKDAARGGQLLTIPEACFQAHGLTRQTATADLHKAAPLLQDLAARAGEHRIKARAMAQSLMPSLGRTEAGILDALLTIYERLHETLQSNVAQDRDGLTDRLRNALAERLGV